MEDTDQSAQAMQNLHSVLGERPWQPVPSRAVRIEKPPVSPQRLVVRERIKRKQRILCATVGTGLVVLAFVLGLLIGLLSHGNSDRRKSKSDHSSLKANSHIITSTETGLKVKATLSMSEQLVECTQFSVMKEYDSSTSWWYSSSRSASPIRASNLLECMQYCTGRGKCYRAIWDGWDKTCWMESTSGSNSWFCSGSSTVSRRSVRHVCTHTNACVQYHKHCLCPVGPLALLDSVTSSVNVTLHHYSLHQLNTAVKCLGKVNTAFVAKRCHSYKQQLT